MTARNKSMALVAAFLGWLFDGFEMGLFPLIGKPALQDLLPQATDSAKNQWFTVIIAVFLVGAATGGVLFGWLGDKMGRVKAMTLAIFTYAIFTGMCAFVTEAWQFAALRFIASLGMGGEWSLGVALVNELWAGRNRAWIAGMIGAASNIGFLLTGVLSLFLNNYYMSAAGIESSAAAGGVMGYLFHNRAWRLLAISGALPALINFFILIFVPESHKWEEEKKRGKTSHWETGDLMGVLIAAIAALVIIYVWSPMTSVGVVVATLVTVGGLAVALWGYLHPVRQYLSRSAAAHDARAHEHEGVFRHLLLGAALASVALLGTWGSAQQAPKWASGLVSGTTIPIIEYTVLATSIGAILVTLLTPLAADILGRRVTYSILCIASLGSAFFFFQMNHPIPAATGLGDAKFVQFFISAFLLGGITASFYGFFPLYFPELFPTSVRATGQGFCFNFGRLIAAIGSLQLANLTVLLGGKNVSPHHALANAYCALCMVYVIGIVLVWFCPETKGKALE
jgi:MFS family permease